MCQFVSWTRRQTQIKCTWDKVLTNNFRLCPKKTKEKLKNLSHNRLWKSPYLIVFLEFLYFCKHIIFVNNKYVWTCAIKIQTYFYDIQIRTLLDIINSLKRDFTSHMEWILKIQSMAYGWCIKTGIQRGWYNQKYVFAYTFATTALS